MCKIKFEITKPGSVEIRVVDVIGRYIVTYNNQYDTPGRYEVDFNGDKLIPGSYYYKIFDLSMQLVNGNGNAGSEAQRMIQSGSLKIDGISRDVEENSLTFNQ